MAWGSKRYVEKVLAAKFRDNDENVIHALLRNPTLNPS